MKIAVTGHRPQKLWGYNIYNEQWTRLNKLFSRLLVENICDEAISGMALGTDMVFALAVLELKDTGYPIKLHCAIPHKDYSSVWCSESIGIYNYIISRADIVKYVCTGQFNNYMMKKRNIYMVDLADKIIAVWDRSKSGTGHTVEYANKCNKPVILIDPKFIGVNS